MHSPKRKTPPSFSSAFAGALVLTVFTGLAVAQKPAVLISQNTQLAKYPTGGVLSSGSPIGSNTVVNASGNLIASTTYGGQIAQFNGQTGAATVLGSYNNGGSVAQDSAGNLYISDLFDSTIVKVPYTNGAYAAIASASSTTPACTGNDTVECTLPGLAPGSVYGYTSVIFDQSGNLYFGATNGGTNAGAIFECSAACLYATTPSAVKIYQEVQPASGNPLLLGALAIDSVGDVFFTDATYANNTAYTSNLRELAALASASTGHAASITTLYSYTIASPSQYDDLLSGVTVDANNTVYFGAQNGGIFAYLNNMGTVDTSSMYTVSMQGTRTLTNDRKGNFYGAAYSNANSGDTAFSLRLGTVKLPATAIGSTGTATATIVVNSSANCNAAGPSAASSTTEFTAAVGSCMSVSITGAPSFPTTISFTPTTPGTRTATLTGTSGTNTGTATLTGVATGGTVSTPTFSPAGGTYSGPQTVSLADATVGSTIYYTLDGSTPTATSTVYTGPITVSMSETVKAFATYAGSTSSAVASATYSITAVVAPTPTFSPGSGSYTTAQSVTIADTLSGAAIYYTTDGSTPTTGSTLYTGPVTVSMTETINAIATATGYTNSAVGSATYTLNVASTWVVNQNGSVTRLNSAGTALATATPTGATANTLGGIAIDAAGDAWAVGNQANSLTEVSPAGALTGSFTGGGLSNPVAVIVDGLGRVWVANTNNSVSVFSNAGVAISPSTGYTGSMSGPSSIRIDQTGSVWITNGTNSTVTRLFGGAAPTVNPLVTGVTGGTTGVRP